MEYQDVPSKFFCLTLPKTSVGEISIVALISGTGKVWIRRGRLSRFSVEIFFSHSAKNFCRGIIYCCTDFRYQKSLERRGEYQDAPSKIFCLTMPKISVGESSIVSLISGTEKVWKGGGVVEYQDVPSKFFCLTLPKISVGEISIVALISGTGKVWIRRGRLSRFSVENFLSHSAKNFCRGIIYCCTDFRYRKSLERRGEYQDAPSKIFCLTVPKISVGESSIVSLISGTEKVWKGGGVVEYQDVPSKFFCLTLPKTSVGESSIVSLISGTEKVRRRGGGG